MTIPAFVETDKIAATYRNGVLQLSMPKSDAGEKRTIPVKG